MLRAWVTTYSSWKNSKSVFIVEVHLALKLVHRHSTYWNKLNRLRIATGRRQTGWLYTSAAEKLSQEGFGTNPASGQSRIWTQDNRFQVWHPDHTATLPPQLKTKLKELIDFNDLHHQFIARNGERSNSNPFDRVVRKNSARKWKVNDNNSNK